MYLIPVIPLFKLKPSVINVFRLTSKNRNANDDGEDESLGYIIIHDKTVHFAAEYAHSINPLTHLFNWKN